VQKLRRPDTGGSKIVQEMCVEHISAALSCVKLYTLTRKQPPQLYQLTFMRATVAYKKISQN